MNDPQGYTGEITADKYVANWTNSNNVSAENAQKLCAGCPLLKLCREYAIEAQEPYGIWGGTRPVDRGITGAIRSSKIWEEDDTE